MPPSHLTRSIFRRLLANEPIIHRGCLRRRHHSSLIPTSTRPLRAPTACICQQWTPHEQRRHFFNLNLFSTKKEATDPDMDPGIDKMMELAKRQRMNARMPEVEDVLTAIKSFFAWKIKKQQPVTDTQAQLVLQSWSYYRADRENSTTPSEDLRRLFGGNLFRDATIALKRSPNKTQAHVDLARFLYEMARVCRSMRSADLALQLFVEALCNTGQTKMARELILQEEREPFYSKLQESNDENETVESTIAEITPRTSNQSFQAKRWMAILEGFVKEGLSEEVRSTLTAIEERGHVDALRIAPIMVDFSLQEEDRDAIKKWWYEYWQAVLMNNPESHADTSGRLLHRVLTWCLAHNEIDTGLEIVRTIMTTNPAKPLWDAIFVWAAGTKNSVDEINRMFGVMKKTNEAIADRTKWRLPDIDTINGLIAFATLQKDPYMAERFITLGREHGIEPDARTYTLQMEYRLSVKDVDGALIAYKALAEQRNFRMTDEGYTEDIPIINELIVALCNTKRHDYDTVMSVTMDLADRRGHFSPETVATLSILHLNRDEAADATDLLNTHAYHYSSADRAHIRDSLIAYTINPKTSTGRAWESYQILRSIFDETPREARTDIMASFFARDRADMAVRIFQSMRMHSRLDTIPTIDTYVSTLMGLAKLRDLENVEIIHNQLKLDVNITQTTYLRNALIIAYTACRSGRKALGFWNDIITSKEGPSYNSIQCALRACEKSPFGDLHAKELWSLLRRRKVDLDQGLWASYGAALAGNGDNDAAITAIEEAEAAGELEVDAFVLGSVFEGAPGQMKQEEIEAWAKEKYPEVWKVLEGFGVKTDEAGMRKFGIDRRISP